MLKQDLKDAEIAGDSCPGSWILLVHGSYDNEFTGHFEINLVESPMDFYLKK